MAGVPAALVPPGQRRVSPLKGQLEKFFFSHIYNKLEHPHEKNVHFKVLKMEERMFLKFGAFHGTLF
jgi:hypothetical protein